MYFRLGDRRKRFAAGGGERGPSGGRTAKNALGLATEQSPILSDGTLGVNWRGMNRKCPEGGGVC